MRTRQHLPGKSADATCTYICYSRICLINPVFTFAEYTPTANLHVFLYSGDPLVHSAIRMDKDINRRRPGSVLDHPGRPFPRQSHPSTGTASVYDSVDDYMWTSAALEDPEDLPPLPAWLLNAPAPAVAAADTARHSPNIKLPPFQSSRPAAWFTSVQQTFHFRGVSDQKNMFTYCYVTLEEEQMQQVDDLIEMYPLLPDAFFRLRDLLVATHSPDAYQRLEQFLALPPLGGEKPSTLLTNMKQLCPPGEDATIMFWGMFLSRPPPLIRIQHAEDWVSPVHALAAHADALVTHNHGGVTAPLLKDQAPLVAAATAHGSKFPACGGKPSGGRPVAASTSAPASDKPWKKLKKFCRRGDLELLLCYDFGYME